DGIYDASFACDQNTRSNKSSAGCGGSDYQGSLRRYRAPQSSSVNVRSLGRVWGFERPEVESLKNFRKFRSGLRGPSRRPKPTSHGEMETPNQRLNLRVYATNLRASREPGPLLTSYLLIKYVLMSEYSIQSSDVHSCEELSLCPNHRDR